MKKHFCWDRLAWGISALIALVFVPYGVGEIRWVNRFISNSPNSPSPAWATGFEFLIIVTLASLIISLVLGFGGLIIYEWLWTD